MPYKRLSCLYDEIESNTRRIFQGSIRTRKRIWQIFSCSRKIRYCGWKSIKRKNWSIRKNYYIFSSWKQWKLLQSWSYWEKSELWRWKRTPNTLQTPFSWRFKKHWQAERYFTDIIINKYFSFYFLTFSDHKRTKVRINEHIFAYGAEEIAQISECSNYRSLN